MAAVIRPFRWFYEEFGLASIHATGRNAYLIILSRMGRTFAYGTTQLILALFFAELEFSDYQIGVFMTLTLVGDVILGTFLTLIADRVGRRKILFGGSFLMILTGFFFALFENFWLLLFAAVVGVVSATGGDFGPFRAIEESMLSELTTPSTRSDCLAWYVTLAAWAASMGSEASGRFIEAMQGKERWTLAGAYHAIFWIYSVMGVVNASLVLLLTDAVEAGKGASDKDYAQVSQNEVDEEIELAESPTHAIGSAKSETQSQPRSKWTAWFSWAGSAMSAISTPTRKIMYKLWILLAVDSLADGMVPYSLTNYYMDLKFHPSKATLGDITSVGYLLAAISAIFAGPLAKKLGLVNTMVFTHIPSSAAVLFFPLPSVLWLTVALFFLRTGLNNMDQAPRAALIAAVVKPEERTAVMGLTSMMRTLAATTGPTVTGLLANSKQFWVAFVAAGAFRLTYDFGLYALFINVKLHEHEPTAPGVGQRSREIDEEMFELADSTDNEETDDSENVDDDVKSHK